MEAHMLAHMLLNHPASFCPRDSSCDFFRGSTSWSVTSLTVTSVDGRNGGTLDIVLYSRSRSPRKPGGARHVERFQVLLRVVLAWFCDVGRRCGDCTTDCVRKGAGEWAATS